MMRREWTSKQALILMTVCLFGGIAGGWLTRGSGASTARASAKTTATPAISRSAVNEAPSPTRLKEQADALSAPLIAKLNLDPKNPDLLTSIGNLYYDAQQYPVAIGYYGRALTSKPSDVAVRTDLGTAYWYMGKADEAIAEFNKALAFAPNNPNTLFNLGLVKWQGKHDGPSAIAVRCGREHLHGSGQGRADARRRGKADGFHTWKQKLSSEKRSCERLFSARPSTSAAGLGRWTR